MSRVNRSLLSRSAPLPGEWLLSYLTRLAYLNRYDSALWIREIVQDRIIEADGGAFVKTDSLHLPTQIETLKCLSDLTRQPEKSLLMMTAHRFVNGLSPAESSLTIQLPSGETLPLIPNEMAKRQTWPAHDARYCPLCLQNGRYHRLQWLPILVSACLEHRCLLNRGCASCGQPLRVEHIIDDRCPFCFAKPSQAKYVDISQDQWGLLTQQVIQYWLGLAPQPSDYSLYWREDVPFPVYLNMVEGLRRVVVRTEECWSFINQYYNRPHLDGLANPQMKDKKDWLPANIHLVCAAVMCALIHWPDNFYAFLDSYRLRGGREPSHVVGEDLAQIYTQLLEKAWRSPPFQFVQEAFNEYLESRYATSLSLLRLRRYVEDADFRERTPFMIETEAARTLRTTPKIMQRLADADILPAYDLVGDKVGRGDRPTYRWYRRDDVQELEQKWREALPLNKAAEVLGVPSKAVRNLIMLGMLKAVRGPNVDGSGAWLVSAESVNRFYEQVQQHVKPLDNESAALSLLEVAQILAAYQYDVAQVLRLAAQGQLIGYRAEGKGDDLSTVRFRPQDVERQCQLAQEQTPLLSFWQIAAKMGVGAESVEKWAANGLLPTVKKRGKRRHVRREEAERFMAEHIFTEQAAELIDAHPNVITKWARRGRLSPVSGPTVDGCHAYLFRRDEAARFMPENRLTAPQVGQLIGKSRSQVSAYIRQGKLKPISGPGIDDCKHYLFLRSDLAASGLVGERG